MCAAGGTALGQSIVHVVPQQRVYYSLFYPGTLDCSIDINGDGTTDFILRSNDPGSSISTAYLLPQGNNGVVSANSYVADMNSGDIVGSSMNPVYQWSYAKTAISGAAILLDSQAIEEGNFVGKTSGYFGFDLLENGAHHYGWICIFSPNNDAALYADIVSWAYQDVSDIPISIGAVPEPSVFSLGACGALFFCIQRCLRR
jgi:hypothetical protein